MDDWLSSQARSAGICSNGGILYGLLEMFLQWPQMTRELLIACGHMSAGMAKSRDAIVMCGERVGVVMRIMV